MKVRLSLSLTCSAGALCLAPGAIAATAADGLVQQALDATDTAAGRDLAAVAGGSEVADIIVTAERRSGSLQRSAIAATAVTGDALRQAGVQRAEDLSALAPALRITSGGTTFTQIFLRGVGNLGVNVFAENAIAFNYDGVYISRPAGVNGQFFDLQRIEVLKGPQGTLYGRNATGGAINVIPNRPTYDLGARIDLEAGSYDLFHAIGMVNLPIVDGSLALRASGQVNSRDGYYNDGSGDDKSQSARLQLRWDASPDLKVNLGGDFHHRGGRGGGAHLASPDTGADPWDGLNSPSAIATYALLGLPPVNESPLTRESFTQFQDSNFYGVNADIEWSTPVGTLTVIPAYRHNDASFDETNSSFNQLTREQQDQFTIEARLASDKSRRLSYIVGVYHFNEKIDNEAYFNQVFNAQTGVSRERNKSWATFGQLGYTLTETFRVTGGLRYTHETKQDNSQLSTRITPPRLVPGNPPTLIPPMAFPATGPGSLPPSILSGKKSFQNVSWKAGIEWDAGERNLIYASAATGYKAGGFFAATSPNIYQPEHLTAFTIGSKNRFFDGTLQINLEAYYWRYRDQQISHLAIRPDGAIIYPTENVGRSTIKGVELEAQWLPAADTLLAAQVQYNDATYGDFGYTLANFNGPADVASRTACPFTQTGPVTYELDCSGFRLPQAPLWRATLAVRQTLPFASGARIVAEAKSLVESKRFLTYDFSPILSEGTTTRSSVSLTYHSVGDRWSLAAYVDNLEDLAVRQTGSINPLFRLFAVSYDPPRTFGVRLSATLGK